tara:strand:+ start:9040 stop:9885 length:846 start_codon:yes stop_codon:yes gene_type:complete
MSKRDIVFIADAFHEDIAGGGEMNNAEAIYLFLQKGHDVHRVYSHVLTPEIIEERKDSFFIVGNFVRASAPGLQALLDTDYLIYEHDHKYLLSRNPADYEDYLAPKEHLVNLPLYENAQTVLCQSTFHRDIVFKNTGLKNLRSLGGNLWPAQVLEYIRQLAGKEKNDKFSILDSNISHKNTEEALRFCMAKNYEYELVRDTDYLRFLAKLGANSGFVFFPQTPETLSRVVVEARMMDMRVISNKNIGATKEDWFKLRGPDLIDYMLEKRQEIATTILKFVN